MPAGATGESRNALRLRNLQGKQKRHRVTGLDGVHKRNGGAKPRERAGRLCFHLCVAKNSAPDLSFFEPPAAPPAVNHSLPEYPKS